MAVFRVERTSDYTVMSNYHLRDKRLSLKAKGLLSQMLSLPEDWDYAFETDIPKEGYDAVYGAFHCSLVTTASDKDAILLTRVAGQMFGAYLPDRTLLDLAGVPRTQVTLAPCQDPAICIGPPDAVR